MKTCKCTSHPESQKRKSTEWSLELHLPQKSRSLFVAIHVPCAARARRRDRAVRGRRRCSFREVSRASASRDRPGERSGRDRRGRARDARAREMAVYFSSKISSPGAPTHTEWSLHRPSPDEPFSGVNLVAVAHADGAVGVYTGASRARARPRYHPRRRRVDFRPTLGRRRSSRRCRFLFFLSHVSAVLRRSPRRVPFGADTDDTDVVLFLLFSSRHRLDALSMMSR